MSFSDLAALAIHDVKNRLAAMAARAEARGDGETVRDALGAAGELSRLLACYKADAGLLRPEVDACCPADLISELVAEMQPLASVEICGDFSLAPSAWYYDESLVRMVLANALHNALRFARRRILVTATLYGDWLEFRVADDGPGYPAEMLAAPDPIAAISEEGVGIGLHLARRVAELHENRGIHGTLRLENTPGAAFCLRLPR